MIKQSAFLALVLFALVPHAAHALYYRLPLKVVAQGDQVAIDCTYAAVSSEDIDTKRLMVRAFSEIKYKLSKKDFDAINAGRSNLFSFEDLICPQIHSPNSTRTVSDAPDEPQFREYFIRSRLPDIHVSRRRTENLPGEAVHVLVQSQDGGKRISCAGLDKLLSEPNRHDALCKKIADQALNRKEFFSSADPIVGRTAKTCHYSWIEEAGNDGRPHGVNSRNCELISEWREKFFDDCHVPRKVPRAKSAPEWIYHANRFACACEMGSTMAWSAANLRKFSLKSSKNALLREDCSAYERPFAQEEFMSLDRIKWIVENQLPERGKGGNL